MGMDSAGGGGIVFGRINNDNVEGVNMENVTVAQSAGGGIAISCPITSIFTNVVATNIVGNGFSFYGGGTSVVMNACYAVTCTQAGFDFNQLNYSTLIGCAAEACGIGYYLHNNCNNVALIGCGAEDQFNRSANYLGVDFQIEGGVGNSIISGYSRNNAEAGVKLLGGGKPVIISYRQIGTAKYSIVTDANVSGAIIQGESVSSPTNYVSGTVKNFADDTKVIHNTGTETSAGDKTFTGKNTFTKPINGSLSTQEATFTDFNAAAASLQKYQGKWRGGYDIIANSPEQGWFIADIMTWSDDNNLGYIVLHYTDHNAVWFGLAISGAINWSRVSNDATVVHNTGTETVAGDKNFTGQTTLKTGNYGLRVTTTGVQKTSDGGTTWVNI